MFWYLFAICALVVILTVYAWWRFFFFYRDPDRTPPDGENIVSPADGTVVYVKQVSRGEVPLAVKKGRQIALQEIFHGTDIPSQDWVLVGVFMHPTSVHVNRSPIRGVVKKMSYIPAPNLPMTLMWMRVLFGLKPYEKMSTHVISNERNTFHIQGNFDVFVTQIADIYVNKIETCVDIGQDVSKGERIGMIKFGSQVDMLIPANEYIQVAVNPGDKVRAGESVVAHILSEKQL